MVDLDKKYAAENLLNELSSYHGVVIRQVSSSLILHLSYCRHSFFLNFPVLKKETAPCNVDETNGGDVHQTCGTRDKERG